MISDATPTPINTLRQYCIGFLKATGLYTRHYMMHSTSHISPKTIDGININHTKVPLGTPLSKFDFRNYAFTTKSTII